MVEIEEIKSINNILIRINPNPLVNYGTVFVYYICKLANINAFSSRDFQFLHNNNLLCISVVNYGNTKVVQNNYIYFCIYLLSSLSFHWPRP